MEFVLGQKVRVKASSWFVYDNVYEDHTDDLPKEKIRADQEEESLEGVIVRKLYKITGKYSPATKDSDGEWHPPFLFNTKRHLVYEIAYSLHRKPVLALPENLEGIE